MSKIARFTRTGTALKLPMEGPALNDFQSALILKIRSELEARRLPLVDEKLEGVRESYYVASVAELRLWIYHDGAEYSDLSDLDCRFELGEFDSLESLSDGFLSQFLSEVDRRCAS